MTAEYNAAERKDVKAAQRAAKLADQNRREVVVQIMSTVNGRKWIWERLESAHIFQQVPVSDALRMAFFEGERNQGLQLLADVMQASPDEFIQAMRESNERRTQQQPASRSDELADGPAPSERSSVEELGRDIEGAGDLVVNDYRHPSEDGPARH